MLSKKTNTQEIYKYFRLLFVKITNDFHETFASTHEAWGNGGKNESNGGNLCQDILISQKDKLNGDKL